MNGLNRRRAAWFVLFILLIFSVAAPLNQFKVPPLMPLLMQEFSLSVAQAGWLMSIFAVTGLILALPSGFIFQRLGFRLTGLLAAGAVLVGAIIGAFGSTMEVELVSRVIEGAGVSLTAVVAPAVIAMWFRSEERATPLGIWATWVPLGSTAMLIVAPLIARAAGWRSVWWFGAAFALLAGVLYYLFVRSGPSGAGGGRPASRITTSDLWRVLRNRDLWLITALFGSFDLVLIGFLTWAPSYLNSERGVDLAHASFIVSLVTMLNLVSNPLAGWLSDRIGSRKWVGVIPQFLMGLLWPLTLTLGEGSFTALMIAIGFISGFVPTAVFAGAVDAVGDERLGGMAMAVVQVGQNAGFLLGPLIVAWLVQSAGWTTAFWALVPLTMVGVVAGLFIRSR